MNRCKIFALFFSFFLIASCTITSAMWDRSYDDTIQRFLISRDGKYVVFIGNEYHYIFDDNSTVISGLLEEQKRNLVFINTQMTRIKVNTNNEVSGYAFIESFAENISREDEVFLMALGFRRNESGSISLKIKLKGKRYKADVDFGESLPRLDRTYIMQIHESTGFFGTIAKAAVTPITITADSVLMIGKILLYPFQGN